MMYFLHLILSVIYLSAQGKSALVPIFNLKISDINTSIGFDDQNYDMLQNCLTNATIESCQFTSGTFVHIPPSCTIKALIKFGKTLIKSNGINNNKTCVVKIVYNFMYYAYVDFTCSPTSCQSYSKYALTGPDFNSVLVCWTSDNICTASESSTASSMTTLYTPLKSELMSSSSSTMKSIYSSSASELMSSSSSTMNTLYTPLTSDLMSSPLSTMTSIYSSSEMTSSPSSTVMSMYTTTTSEWMSESGNLKPFSISIYTSTESLKDSVLSDTVELYTNMLDVSTVNSISNNFGSDYSSVSDTVSSYSTVSDVQFSSSFSQPMVYSNRLSPSDTMRTDSYITTMTASVLDELLTATATTLVNAQIESSLLVPPFSTTLLPSPSVFSFNDSTVPTLSVPSQSTVPTTVALVITDTMYQSTNQIPNSSLLTTSLAPSSSLLILSMTPELSTFELSSFSSYLALSTPTSIFSSIGNLTSISKTSIMSTSLTPTATFPDHTPSSESPQVSDWFSTTISSQTASSPTASTTIKSSSSQITTESSPIASSRTTTSQITTASSFITTASSSTTTTSSTSNKVATVTSGANEHSNSSSGCGVSCIIIATVVTTAVLMVVIIVLCYIFRKKEDREDSLIS